LNTGETEFYSKTRYRIIRDFYNIPAPPRDNGNSNDYLFFYEKELVCVGDLLVEGNLELALKIIEVFQSLVDETISQIDELISQEVDFEIREELEREFKSSENYRKLMYLRLLTYEEFLDLFKLRPRKDREGIDKFSDISHHPLWKPIYERLGLDEGTIIGITTRYTPDPKGYFEFLKDYGNKKVIEKILKTIHPLFFSEKDFERHAYITGMTGSGKSELLKFLIYQLLYRRIPFFRLFKNFLLERINPRKSIFIIDPHGDLAHQVYVWQENRYILKEAENPPLKIVYFDPFLCKNKKPVLNPFDIKDKSEETIDLVSQELARVFQELIKDSKLSLQMETLLIPCIATLLRRKNSTLRDLQRFMNDELNKDLVEEGLKSPNPAHREFFKNAFYSKHYTPTKQSIYTKIQSLLNSKAFHDITVGKSTIDLEDLMNSNALVIFNLSKGKLGTDTSEALGRMIIALLTSFAFKRANIPESRRQRTFVFIDEFHNYIGKSLEVILTESRKYKLFLILAQQFLGQGMNNQLRNAILSNTYLKFIGMNALNTLKAFSQETGINLEDLQGLKQGEFFVKKGTGNHFKIKVPSYLLGYSNQYPTINNLNFWIMEDLMCKSPYYREIKKTSETQEIEPKSTEEPKQEQENPKKKRLKPKFEL
jgi:hypothetical protein